VCVFVCVVLVLWDRWVSSACSVSLFSQLLYMLYMDIVLAFVVSRIAMMSLCGMLIIS